MPTHRVLVVEDDAAIAAVLVRGLRQEGFEVELLANGADVVRRVTSEPWDAVVLDLMLPDESGFTILEGLRHRSSVPVIVLTARGELEDRVRTFELGAADYVSKPFWMGELVARLRARMRSSKMTPNRVAKLGPATIDLDAREISIDARAVEMTRTEFDVLAYLVQRRGRAVSRDQLADDVLRDVGDARTVDAHVAKIRKKLGAAGALLVTVWGVGYRCEGDP